VFRGGSGVRGERSGFSFFSRRTNADKGHKEEQVVQQSTSETDATSSTTSSTTSSQSTEAVNTAAEEQATKYTPLYSSNPLDWHPLESSSTDVMGCVATVQDGMILGADGELLDTSKGDAKGSKGYVKVVMTGDGKILYADPEDLTSKGWTHANVAGQQKVAFAGTWHVPLGFPLVITGNSEHYRPGPEGMVNFLHELRAGGVNLQQVIVEPWWLDPNDQRLGPENGSWLEGKWKPEPRMKATEFLAKYDKPADPVL
jgi:hypothetical protein